MSVDVVVRCVSSNRTYSAVQSICREHQTAGEIGIALKKKQNEVERLLCPLAVRVRTYWYQNVGGLVGG